MLQLVKGEVLVAPHNAHTIPLLKECRPPFHVRAGPRTESNVVVWFPDHQCQVNHPPQE